MTRNERTAVAFANYHRQHCDSDTELRVFDGPVLCIRCVACYARLDLTFKNAVKDDERIGEVAIALMLNYRNATVQ